MASELIIIPFFFASAVHYNPGPLNNLFGMTRGSDDNISLQFQGQASLFSERSSVDTLIHGGDQYTTRSILTTAPFEDIDRRTYRKPDFMFGDAAPDPDHQLLQGKGGGFSSWMVRSSTFRPTSVIFLCLPSNA